MYIKLNRPQLAIVISEKSSVKAISDECKTKFKRKIKNFLSSSFFYVINLPKVLQKFQKIHIFNVKKNLENT